ncbi:hypothetical protein C0Q70_21588 [Pomacea canaliculata]|uniref:Uncharacterized protein n=2 Tax=Pomacea canaliculata TaxID=400727 RepID=A0A2T7NCY3_POMCA|nr:hypothetical protein C0Q70_21588 [Pomacea canaliculata]
MDSSNILEAEETAMAAYTKTERTESTFVRLKKNINEPDASDGDIICMRDEIESCSKELEQPFIKEDRRDTPKPGTAERTQLRRSSRRQNCSRVTFSLDLTESAYDKWLLIGSTNGLKNDTEIALFLIQQCESYEKALAGIPTGATCVGCYKALTLTCSKCHIPSQSTKPSGVKRKSASEAKNTRLKGSGQAPRGCILAKTDSNKLGSNTKKHAKQTNGRRRRFSDSGNSEGGGDTFDDDGVISDDFAGHSSDLDGTENHSNAKEEPKLQILRVVKQEELLDFFDSVPEISKANILRKGRFLTTPDLVTIVKGRNGFLSDIFKKRDGVDFRRRKVVCREILQCDGRGRCQRACGGLGKCVSDCDKDGIRRSVGHHCSFRVHLKMYSNDIGKWEVSTQGHHVPPHETWEPPQNKSVLRDPRIRAQYEEAYKGGVTSAEDMLSIMCTEARASKKQYYSFMRTMKRRRQRNNGFSSDSVTDHLAYQTLPMGVQDCSDGSLKDDIDDF